MFKSEFDFLIANRWVIFFARESAHKNSDKASIKDLDTSLYMLSFETAPRACFFDSKIVNQKYQQLEFV